MEVETKKTSKKAKEYLENNKIIKSTIGPDKVMNREKYEAYKRELEELSEKYLRREKIEQKAPRKRTLRILYNAHNKEIKKILLDKENDFASYFNQIRITKEAYYKANLIAKRTAHLTGGNEVYMYLLNDKKRKEIGDNAIRDAYILKDQKITSVECGRPSIKGESESLKDIEKQDKYLFAWGHSHGNLGTFHSSLTDVRNLDNLTAYGTKLKITPKPFSCSDTSFIFRFIPSLVFNARNSRPSCAIGISYPNLELGRDSIRGFYMNQNPELKIIEEDNDIELRKEIINKEIIQRVHYYGKMRIGEKIEKPGVELIKIPKKEEEISRELAPREGVLLRELKNIAKESERGIDVFFSLEKLKEGYGELRRNYDILEKNHQTLLANCENQEKRIESLENILNSGD